MNVLLEAIQSKDLDKIKNQDCAFEKNSLLTTYAIFFKQREILKYLVEEQKIPINLEKNHVFEVSDSDFDFILFLSSFGIKLHKNVFISIICKNYFILLQNIMENELIVLANSDLMEEDDFVNELFCFAAKNDDLIILNYLLQKFSKTNFFGKKTCKHLTAEIYLGAKSVLVLNWLKTNNCPINEDIPFIFVQSGNFEFLLWLEENNIKINYNECLKIALEYHHYELIHYLTDKSNLDPHEMIKNFLEYFECKKSNLINSDEIIKVLKVILPKIENPSKTNIIDYVKYAVNTNFENVFDFVFDYYKNLIDFNLMFPKYSFKNQFSISNQKIIQKISTFPGFNKTMVWDFLGNDLTIDYLNYLDQHFEYPKNKKLHLYKSYNVDVFKWLLQKCNYFNESTIIRSIIESQNENERTELIKWFQENVQPLYQQKIDVLDVLDTLVEQENADKLFLCLKELFVFEETNFTSCFDKKYSFYYDSILNSCLNNHLINILLTLIDLLINLPAIHILTKIIVIGDLQAVILVYDKLIKKGYTFNSKDINEFKLLAQSNGFYDIFDWLNEVQ